MKQVSITNAVKIKNQRVKPFDGEKKYLATGGLIDDTIKTEVITYKSKPTRADLLLTENQLIVARMKGTNKVLLIDKNLSNLIVSTGFLVLEVQKEWHPRFLFHYLVSSFFQKQKDRFSIGAIQKAINNEKFKEILIPEISYEDQKRIVKILDEADSLRQKRKQTITLLDEYLKSVFLDMFGDIVTNPKSWKKLPLKDFGTIVTGNTPPRNDYNNYSSKFIEWIKTDNIVENKTYISEATEYLSQKGLEKARCVDSGSILVACIAGSIESIGRVAITDRKISFNQQINAIQPNENVESFFLYWLIKLSRKYIQNHATKGMKRILTKGEFEKIKMILPPFILQQKFSLIAKKYETLKQKMLVQSEEMEKQFQTLMQRSFLSIN